MNQLTGYCDCNGRKAFYIARAFSRINYSELPYGHVISIYKFEISLAGMTHASLYKILTAES